MENTILVSLDGREDFANEVIDFIEAKGLNYNLGNAIKYISRALYKGKKEEDIAKAIWYLQREIK